MALTQEQINELLKRPMYDKKVEQKQIDEFIKEKLEK